MADISGVFLVIMVILALVVFKGIKIVPQQQIWILEKLGKFDRKMEPGLNILVPFIEVVAYKHSLKEQAIDVMEQTAITNDNVTLRIDGVLYVRIIDPVAASYGVNDPYYAVLQLAQTSMRSEIGKITLDKTFEERETINANIVNVINEAAVSWGIQCMRYEIKDITPPTNVLKAMELQVAAERQKRAEILESEGKKQSQINLAEAYKQEIVLRSEASYTDQVNRAKGQAEAVLLVAEATSEGIEKIAKGISKEGGDAAVAMKLAEQYTDAFREIAKETNTVIVPASAYDIGSMVAQALTIFDTIKKRPIPMSTWNNKADDKNS
ncbi:MAG: SPFH domain-containing protein [Rickettsiales endosymbiont of Dermacentor nuttalli]